MKLLIKDILIEKGISQKEFAKKVSLYLGRKVTLQYINGVVNGKKNPTVNRLVIFAKILDVDVRDFFPKTKKP